ncbi:MAG TPA: FISUMP domain-containing protein [Fibrobacteraceae bacterium]|nr:FISUMP domain-containing protein [Fibrobacteraceae bacterium]
MLKSKFVLAIFLLSFSLALLSTCTKLDKTFTDDDSRYFTGSISGVVTSKHGTTLSGVLVTVSPGGQTTVSTSGGKFEISGIAPGSHSLSYVKSDYVDTTSTDSVTLGLLDSVVLDSNQQLTYMYATVTGTITDSIGTTQLTGTTIGVSVENQTASLSTSSGTFTLTKVEPGTVRLFAAISGSGYGYLDTMVSSDDTLKDLTVRISRKGGTVTGTVVDSSGNAQSGVTVSAVGGVLTSTTGSDGGYILTTVPSEGSVQLMITSTAGDTLGTADVSVDEGDSVEVPAVMVGDEGLGDDLLKVLPSTVVVQDTSDTLILVATALWSSEDDAPCWYLWSTDDGNSWDTTRVSSYKIDPTVLVELLDDAECNSEYCIFTVQVKAVSVYGISSDMATVTVEVKRAETLSLSSSSILSSSSSPVSSSSSISKDWFNSSISYGTMTDERDGQTYRTVIIGTQMWMAENLNYGTMIQGSVEQNNDSLVERFCYNDSEYYCGIYGGLYQWAEVMGIASQYNSSRWAGADTTNRQGICPQGWHIPTTTEWGTLVSFVEANNNSGEAGTSLKANSSLWLGISNTDDWGLSVIPATSYNEDEGGWIESPGGSANHWTATEASASKSWDRCLYGGRSMESVYTYDNNKTDGLSLRCLYDTTIVLSSSSEASSSSIGISSSSEESSSSVGRL